MRPTLRHSFLVVLFLLSSTFLFALQSKSTSVSDSAVSSIPRVVRFSGSLKDADGHPRSGSVGVIFAIYDKQDGIAPVWLETQSVTSNESGSYSVLLGSVNSGGLPASIFASGEARWIGVQAEGQAEQPRILLVSVPYALKAADADTLGGKPLSAFLLADNKTSSRAQREQSVSTINAGATNPIVNFVPKFDSASSIINSSIFDNGFVGIGTTAPTTTLDVNGLIRSASGIKFGDNSIQSTAVPSNCAAQQIPKWTGSAWACSAESGTITGVLAASGLIGGGTSGNVILQLDPAVARTDVSNNFTARQSVIGSSASVLLSATQSNSVPLPVQPTFIQAQTSIPAGVAGYATATADTAAGVAGFSSSISSPAVLGWNGSTTGVNDSATGVLGVTDNPIGRAVEGEANSLTGTTIGVRGKSVSTSGTGIAGNASAGSGLTVGVQGNVNSPNGTAGLFTAPGGVSSYFLRGNANGPDLFKVDATGTVFAAAYKDLAGNPISGGGGSGTVTSITAGSGLTGGTITNSGTIAVDSTVARTGLSNTFAVSQTINDNTAGSALGINQAGAGAGLNVSAPGLGVFPNGATIVATSTDSTGASGSNFPRAILAIANSSGSRAVQANSLATTGSGVGVIGFSAGDTGVGVVGQANSATGPTNGVLGTAFSTNGAGVFGQAGATTGVTAGVRGTALSPNGKGTEGDSFPTTANAVTSSGTGVLGTYGFNSDFTVNPNATAGFGVRGQTAAAGGFSMGVRGEATSATGSVIGVSGFTASSGGFGVEGFANDATGATLGVRGVVSSPNGVAGQFENNGGGLILRGYSAGLQKFSVDGSGTVTGISFVGDGSGLTGLSGEQTGTINTFSVNQIFNASIGIGTASPTQPLDVVGNGSFTGDVGSTSISLPDTQDAATGVINFGGVPFLHNFGGNVYLGGAGNFLSAEESNANIGIGNQTLQSNIGTTNTAVGHQVMASNTFGSDNVAMGFWALRENTIGGVNVAIGESALQNNLTASENVAIGVSAGSNIITGSSNTFIGANANSTSDDLSNATAIGANALVGQDNSIVLGDVTVKVGIGTSAPTEALDVQGNIIASGTITAVDGFTGTIDASSLGGVAAASYARLDSEGNQSFSGSITATNFVGQLGGVASSDYARLDTATLQSFTSNVTVPALFLNGGIGGLNAPVGNNFGFGSGQLNSLTTGTQNIAVGSLSLFANTGGIANTAVGHNSLKANTIGNDNAAFGPDTLPNNTLGSFNTAIGAGALNLTGGSSNTALGVSAGSSNTNGSSNTFIGAIADAGAGSLTNATAIGAGTMVFQSNALILGNNADVGIGTSTPTAKLDVVGNIATTGKFATYNGIATSANGVASIHGSFNATSQTASIGTTTLFTPGVGQGGLFRASCYLVTTAGTGGPSIFASIQWVDDSTTSQSMNCGTLGATAGSFSQTSVILQSVSGQPITFNTTGSVSFTYSIYITLEKLI